MYHAIKQLGKGMNPVLHDVQLDYIKKYLNRTIKTKYIVSSKSKLKKEYWDQICKVREEL